MLKRMYFFTDIITMQRVFSADRRISSLNVRGLVRLQTFSKNAIKHHVSTNQGAGDPYRLGLEAPNLLSVGLQDVYYPEEALMRDA